MLNEGKIEVARGQSLSPLGRPVFIPPDTDRRDYIMSEAQEYCRTQGLIDRRNILNTDLSVRHDGEPVYLYRFIGADELVGLLQRGVRWASDTPVNESLYSFSEGLLKALQLTRNIRSGERLKTQEDYVTFLRSVGIKSPQDLSDAAFGRDAERLRALLKDEFSPYERAIMQKPPLLSGVNGFFSTSVIPSDSSYVTRGNYCYVEIAVPASRMMPPRLMEYYEGERSYHDNEVEVALEYFTIEEVTRFYFNRDDMLDDADLRRRLPVRDDGRRGGYGYSCPFRDLRFRCDFLNYLPAEIRDNPERWQSGDAFKEIPSSTKGIHLC
jgi:hypothetical protein